VSQIKTKGCWLLKKLSLSLLAAVTVAFGVLSFAVPTQTEAATKPSVKANTIKPNIEEGYYYADFYFDSYPPQSYVDESGFQGVLRSVTALPDGRYIGTYYGTTF
jgi:hypothetical protein